MWDMDNMFLNGPYEPWREEGVAYDLEIDGELPAGLNGALFRTSTSQLFRPPDTARHHWFDGDGMIHAVYLREGRAAARNRYVMTAGLKLEMQEGRALFGSFMNGGAARTDESGPPLKNPANTNVALFDDRLLVFCEGDVPHELRPDTLETVNERYDFHGSVNGPTTAHFKVDPNNGDLLFFTNMAGTVHWYRADRHGVVLDVHTVELGVPTFTHDYVVTDDYAVFLVSPTMVRMENVMSGLPSTVWEPETLAASRWAVLHRRTGQVDWIEADEPFAQTHFLNAYQDGSKIIVDGHRTDRFGATREEIEQSTRTGEWNKWFTELVAAPWRWELDLASGTVSERQITDILGEFPRINDTHTGRTHRFGYYATTRGVGVCFTDGLAKHDYVSDRTELQTLNGALTSPSEPTYVPRDGSTAEDDGWVLSTWYDPARDRCEVIIQEAQDFSAPPIARIKLNHRIPMGFHGNWASAEELDAALAPS